MFPVVRPIEFCSKMVCQINLSFIDEVFDSQKNARSE